MKCHGMPDSASLLPRWGRLRASGPRVERGSEPPCEFVGLVERRKPLRVAQEPSEGGHSGIPQRVSKKATCLPPRSAKPRVSPPGAMEAHREGSVPEAA